MSYDYWNRLASVERLESGAVAEVMAEYAYDALNRRIERRVGEKK